MTAPVVPAKESYWQEEPARLSGQVAALLGLLAALGLQLSDQTTSAITAAVAGIATLLGAYVLRQKVTSPATARRQASAHAALMDEADSSASVISMLNGATAPPAPQRPAGEPTGRAQQFPRAKSPAEYEAAKPKALGKRPPSNRPALLFAEHLVAVPTHPIADLAPDLSWPMDHNDTVGDCVVAGADHTLQAVYTQLTGSYVNASDALLLTWYQTQNPKFKSWSQGGTSADGGMDIQTFLEYLVKQDRILGFAKVDHTNLDEMRAATYLGLGVITGEVLTSKNMSEKVWDYHKGDPEEGGHCTVNVGYNPTEDQVSWGSLYSMTDAFVTHNLDEAWFVITQAHVDHPAFRAGFDLASFAAAYKAITGKAFPVTVTPPPTPPAPTPTPAPVPPAPSADTFLDEVSAFPKLGPELARLAANKGETVVEYAARRLASETHTLS